MEDVLTRPGSMGSDGLKWWIGRVAPRAAWAGSGTLTNDKDVGVKGYEPEIDIYYNRVKVSVVGYHDQIANPYDLPWAHILATPMLPAGYGYSDQSHYLEGGESVFGFWLDGDDEQKPVIVGVFYRHKKAEDLSPPLSGGDLKTTTKPDLESEPTGATAGTNVGTSDKIPEVRYKPPYDGYDVVTGKFINPGIKTRIPGTNEGSSEKGMTSAALKHHAMLKESIDRPSCRRDDAINQITGLLGDFAEFLIGVEQYADLYINGTIGVLENITTEINLIAKNIAGIITSMFNGVRTQIFALVGERIQSFINSLIPEEIKPIFGEATKQILDTIFCIFQNLIAGLFKTIADFLGALIGKFINAPLCAAEQLVGALLSKLTNELTAAISPILQSLSDTLGGALGSISEIVGQALEVIGLIFNFIGCDENKCPLPSRFSTNIGPSQGQRDSARSLFESISILNIPTSENQDVGGFLEEAQGNVDSIFGEPTDEQLRNAQYIASLAGPCDSKVLRCGPPQIEIFGGDGIGGFANAVVSNTGSIIGAQILERGFGYTVNKPPYVTFKDACGDGKGARGRAIIGDDGGIDRIIIDFEGYGYRNNFGDVKTIYGTIDGGDANSNRSNSDSKTVTGQIDDVIVRNPGFGYNPGDTIDIGGAKLTPTIIGGRIVKVEVNDPGTGFTSIPELTINSETGVGADLQPVLKFTEVNEDSLPPGEVVVVVNCVGK
jgi:hypothetical protein